MNVRTRDVVYAYIAKIHRNCGLRPTALMLKKWGFTASEVAFLLCSRYSPLLNYGKRKT